MVKKMLAGLLAVFVLVGMCPVVLATGANFSFTNDFNGGTDGAGASLSNFGVLKGGITQVKSEDNYGSGDNDNGAGLSRVYRDGVGNRETGDMSYVVEKKEGQNILAEKWPSLYASFDINETKLSDGDILTVETSLYLNKFDIRRHVMIFSKNSSANESVVIELTISDLGVVSINNTTPSINANVELKNGEWNDLAFVFYGGTKTFDFYVNKKLINRNGKISVTNEMEALSQLRYRHQTIAPNSYADGEVITGIDDIAIYTGQPAYAGDISNEPEIRYTNSFDNMKVDTSANVTTGSVNTGFGTISNNLNMQSVASAMYRKGLGDRGDVSFSIEKNSGTAISNDTELQVWNNGGDGISFREGEEVLTIETSMYFGDLNASSRVINLRLGTLNASCTINTEGKFIAPGISDTGITVAAGKWYHFGFVLYIGTTEYDLYVDKQKINKDAKLNVGAKIDKFNSVRYMVNLPSGMAADTPCVTAIDDIAFYYGRPLYAEVPDGEPLYDGEFEFSANGNEATATMDIINNTVDPLYGTLILAAFNDQDQLINVSVGETPITISAMGAKKGIQSKAVNIEGAAHVKAFFWSGKNGASALEKLSSFSSGSIEVSSEW